MIGTFEIKCFAANPQKPLPPVFAFNASPSSLRILEVPRKIGEWQITAVKVAVSYPDNSISVAEAVRTGNVWVATFTGCGVSGKTANGIQILADGTDENGAPVEGYVLGVGDLYILDRDSTIAADDEKWYVRYCEEIPATPATGDLIVDNGAVKMFDGEEWIVLSADLSDYATKQELNSAIQGVRQDIPTKTSQLTNDSGFVDETTLNTALTTKQDKLSNAQISAIDSVVDERKTVVTYTNGETATFDIEGELTSSSITNILNVVTVKIGNTMTSIGQTAFFGCSVLTSVTIPNSVTSIGEDAFSNCSVLTSVTIPDSVTSIGRNAFGGCSGLTSVTIPNSVTSIGEDAFSGCIVLTSVTIPDSVTSIGSFAFSYCTSLTGVTIPDSVTIIGSGAFLTCTDLTSVTFEGKSLAEVQAMTDYPWSIPDPTVIRTWNDASQEWTDETKQNKLTTPQISAIDSVVTERTSVVTYTDGSTLAFHVEGAWTGRIPNAENAVTLKIGEGVTSLGNSVFFECTNLTTVQLPDTLETISDGAFFGCTSLARISFGNGLKTIGNGVFQGCTSLTAIEIPDGVTTLAGADFYGCTSLTSVTIPASVTTIGLMQFIDCTSLSNVIFKGRTLAEIQALQYYPWAALTTVFRTENNATKEWVEADYVKAAVMTESEYGQITPQADTVYFVTEDHNA